METWESPFKLPVLGTEEFFEARRKAVEQFGYAVNYPDWDDIVKYKGRAAFTQQEYFFYKHKQFDLIEPSRLAIMLEAKARNRQIMQNMLRSPTPDIMFNAGAIVTSIDNSQDALGTIGVLSKLAIKFLPKAIGKLLVKPTLGIMTAAEVLNVANSIGRFATSAMGAKRIVEALTSDHPFTKKARVKRALSILNPWPTYSNAIEAAQVTNDVFGYGLSLGPIIGAAQDSFYGMLRTEQGKKVAWVVPQQYVNPTTEMAYKIVKQAVQWMKTYMAVPTQDFLEWLFTLHLAYQNVDSIKLEDSPILDPMVLKAAHVRSNEPYVLHPIVHELIMELMPWGEDQGGWVINNKPYATYSEILEHSPKIFNDALKWVYFNQPDIRHQHFWGSLMTQTMFQALSAIAPEGGVEYDYTEPARFAQCIMSINLVVDMDQEPAKINQLADFIDQNEKDDIHLNTGDYIRYIQQQDIKLLRISEMKPPEGLTPTPTQ